MIAVDLHLWRLWIFGRRVHHFIAGFALVSVGRQIHQPWLVLVGAALIYDDREDLFPRRYPV